MKLLTKKFKIFLLISIALILVYIVFNVASICMFGSKDETRKADIAIVLGASTNHGELSPVYQERVNHAIGLYNGGYVEKLIMTGGFGKGNDTSDSYAAKQYAILKHIPAEDILTEDASTITQENLENAKKIMDDNGYETALVVSDPLHMKRATLLAADIGITAYSSPTKTTKYISLRTKIPFLAREAFFYIGYKWYRIFV